MENSTPVGVPLAGHFKFSMDWFPKTDGEMDEMARVPYASAIRSIMYGMVCLRPDLTFAVSVLSRYMGNPGRTHCDGVKWLLRYISGTLNVGLVFDGDESRCEMCGYIDLYFVEVLQVRSHNYNL